MAASVATSIAQRLKAAGIRRVFGVPGGHVQPVWDALFGLGVEVVGTRHEMGAALMAQAHSELAGGVGMALVTAGPGLTNAMTGIANAAAARTPLLVLSGRPPRPQVGRGALQEMPQSELVRPLCRAVEIVPDRDAVLPALNRALAAAVGVAGEPGPVYVDFPTDLLREAPLDAVPGAGLPVPAPLEPAADPAERAAGLIRGAGRVLVVGGRGLAGASEVLAEFLDRTGAAYLETAESRGVLDAEHPAQVPAMRARAMAEAELVITLGRRLDFQLAYGSPAVFRSASAFIRVGRYDGELSGNREPEVALRADPAAALAALNRLPAAPAPAGREWRDGLRAASLERSRRLAAELADPPPTGDGRMHPYALLSAVQRLIDAAQDPVVIADGGDILSFARVALRGGRWLDPGALGCLGVGVPYAVAAGLLQPRRRVVSVVGDGAFGLSAMEVETAVRTGAQALWVVADNSGWNIERYDQLDRYGRPVAVDLGGRYDELARSLGAHGERVERPEDLDAALARALARLPAVVCVPVSQEPVSPDGRSGLAWVPDRQPLAGWDQAERDGAEAARRRP